MKNRQSGEGGYKGHGYRRRWGTKKNHVGGNAVKKVKMPFGEHFIELDVPEEAVVHEAAYMAPLPDPVVAMDEALMNPIGTSPLHEIAWGRRFRGYCDQ